MFCAAMPAVAAATGMVAQREKRSKVSDASMAKPAESRRETRRLIPLRLSQCGALALVGLLIGSAFYHSHFPG
jgi:hypothetical protein